MLGRNLKLSLKQKRKMDNTIYYIYGLFALESPHEIRYIGYSINCEERYKEHIRDVKREKVKTYKKKWINSVLKKGDDIGMVIIDSLSGLNEIKELEKYYINNYLSSEFRITNGTIGGDGGVFTEEVRKKLSESSKGKKMSEESKIKISESRKGKKLSEEHKRKISETNKRLGIRIDMTPEVRQKLSEANKGKESPMKGKKHTEETKNKISQSKKGVGTKKKKPVLQIDPKTKEIVNEYASLTEATQLTKINNIHRCITGGRKTAGNYEWKYKL